MDGEAFYLRQKDKNRLNFFHRKMLHLTFETLQKKNSFRHSGDAIKAFKG
jgi:hypothetical protein